MTKRLNSFPPIIPKEPKVLILGSMPGKISLEKGEYYGNARNHFWPILFKLFKVEPIEEYEKSSIRKRTGNCIMGFDWFLLSRRKLGFEYNG